MPVESEPAVAEINKLAERAQKPPISEKQGLSDWRVLVL